MINRLLMALRPVAGGFDPVSLEYAQEYSNYELSHFNPHKVDALEERLGGLAGKRVLDLGGGPGQYSIEFAKRGAKVTWHDISRNYLSIAQAQALSQGVRIEFSLGYMEEASRFINDPFDLVFNRICWFYCVNDSEFATMIHKLISPGGMGYIDNYMNPGHGMGKLRYWVNSITGIKIGHPPPPPGRLERVFRRFQDLDVEVTSVTSAKEQIFLTKRVSC